MTAAADGQELGSREIRVRVWGSAGGGKQGERRGGTAAGGPRVLLSASGEARGREGPAATASAAWCQAAAVATGGRRCNFSRKPPGPFLLFCFSFKF